MKKLSEITDWHQLINEVVCGDCLEGMKLLPDKCIDLVLTDPPYALEFPYDGYEDTEENLKTLLQIVVPESRRVGKLVAIMTGITPLHHYPKPDWILACSWNTTGSYGKMGYTQWMPIVIYGEDIKGLGKVNNILKSDHVVIEGGGGVGFTRNGDEGHPCPKPMTIITKLIRRLSNEGDLVLDPFMGSWASALGAKEGNRKFIGFEQSEKYCQIGEERLRQQNLF